MACWLVLFIVIIYLCECGETIRIEFSIRSFIFARFHSLPAAHSGCTHPPFLQTSIPMACVSACAFLVISTGQFVPVKPDRGDEHSIRILWRVELGATRLKVSVHDFKIFFLFFMPNQCLVARELGTDSLHNETNLQIKINIMKYWIWCVSPCQNTQCHFFQKFNYVFEILR